jgi:hypothetical protein
MNSRLIRHLMLLLGLLAALASTPLRLVEAASDQARTISELDGDSTIEPLDGGVGDEPETLIRSQGTLELTSITIISAPWFDSFISAFAPTIDRALAAKAERPPRDVGTLARRLAKLKRLLI